jgi:hypothetical protein
MLPNDTHRVYTNETQLVAPAVVALEMKPDRLALGRIIFGSRALSCNEIGQPFLFVGSSD